MALEDRTVPAGGLDPTFGNGGKLLFNFALTDRAKVSALQADGKIVVGGSTWTGQVSGGHTDFALARFLPNGTLDTSFGTGGRVITHLSDFSESVSGLTVLPDGKILAGGSVRMLDSDKFALVRYNPNGSIDSSFGTAGVVTTLIGLGVSMSDMVLQPDGKIVAAGQHGVQAGSSHANVAVARYNPDGSLDPSFGTAGVVSTTVSIDTLTTYRVALQPDGKVLVSGEALIPEIGRGAFINRYLTDGTLDATFDGDGIAALTFPGHSDGSARGLAAQPDGRIVVGGTVHSGGTNVDLAMARLLPNGAPDSTFDDDGRVVISFGFDESIDAVALQPDGRIVAVGFRGNPGGGYAHVTRFNGDGSLDQSFGTNGSVFTQFLPGGSSDSFNHVLIQPDGMILATGLASRGTNDDFILGRYLPGASVVVSPLAPLTTTEAGGTAQFSVALSQAPTADVTISLSVVAGGEGTLSASQLVFTPANWQTPQAVTVTGVDDPFDDGDLTYYVRFGAAVSADAEFAGLRRGDVTVVNVDDDTAGFTVVPTSGLVTHEAGPTSATFTVVLTCLPRDNVTITLSSSSPLDGAPTVNSLTFTPANAFTPQTVTVAGADELVDDDDVTFTVVTAPAASTDPAYAGLNAADVEVLNVDNDTAAIEVTAASPLVTTEAGGIATFTVRLATIPRADVAIGVSSSMASEGTVVPASLVFPADATALNPRTVTVTGVNDFFVDGDRTYTIVLAAATSTDAKYTGMDPPDLDAINRDDDVAEVIVTPTTGLTTTEAGGTATFTVRLRAVPSTNVTIALSSNNTGEGTVSPASLTFTSANALTNQTVTVTGVNDGVVDGPIAYAIVTAAVVSTDPNFNGLDVPDVAVTNLDDDPISIVSYSLNNGAAQRSMFKGFAFTFSQVVNIGPGAFRVRRIDDGYEPGLFLTPTVANGRTTMTVTFVGAGVVAGSVPDGIYALTVSAAAVTDTIGQQLDGDGNGQPGGDFAVNFHRLFGDVDGNRSVNAFDLSQFRPAFGTVVGNANYRAYLDFDGNGAINAFDFAQFRDRFGVTLIGPP